MRAGFHPFLRVFQPLRGWEENYREVVVVGKAGLEEFREKIEVGLEECEGRIKNGGVFEEMQSKQAAAEGC